MANKHHPDKGGDQNKFKDISVAYDTLSDTQKRQEYDTGGPQVHMNSGNFNDVFNNAFQFHFGGPGGAGNPFGDLFGRRQQRNRDLNIQCQVTLLDSFVGKQFTHYPVGRAKLWSLMSRLVFNMAKLYVIKD